MYCIKKFYLNEKNQKTVIKFSGDFETKEEAKRELENILSSCGYFTQADIVQHVGHLAYEKYSASGLTVAQILLIVKDHQFFEICAVSQEADEENIHRFRHPVDNYPCDNYRFDGKLFLRRKGHVPCGLNQNGKMIKGTTFLGFVIPDNATDVMYLHGSVIAIIDGKVVLIGNPEKEHKYGEE